MSVCKRDGVSIYYELSGQGEPVLLIQGIGVAGSGWKLQTDDLSRHYQTLIFDNRGLGQSTPCTSAISIEAMAGDVAALMDQVGWTSAHIVGHSMGGVIAQEFALKYPKRARSLSLLCTFARGRDGARLTPWVLWVSLRTRLGPRAWRRRAYLEMLFSSAYLRGRNLDEFAASLVPLLGRDLADQPAILMKQLRAMGRHDSSARLPQLRALPTLVISARQDPIAKPEYGQQIAAGIEGAVFEVMENCAHASILEDAPTLNARLRRFFQG